MGGAEDAVGVAVCCGDGDDSDGGEQLCELGIAVHRGRAGVQRGCGRSELSDDCVRCVHDVASDFGSSDRPSRILPLHLHLSGRLFRAVGCGVLGGSQRHLPVRAGGVLLLCDVAGVYVCVDGVLQGERSDCVVGGDSDRGRDHHAVGIDSRVDERAFGKAVGVGVVAVLLCGGCVVVVVCGEESEEEGEEGVACEGDFYE